MNYKYKPKYISLFSSAGVGCYGFQSQGFECIVTNEILEKRLKIQKINKKCTYDSGYILGNIMDPNIKDLIFKEIKEKANNHIDVIIATPPCQGMSIANHKKNEKDTLKNSLVIESINIIDKVQPLFFIFENVPSFMKTLCVFKETVKQDIGTTIYEILSKNYVIIDKIINFKDYGANSSRKRTLVIGVSKKISNFISPFELFPSLQKQKNLRELISHLDQLEWGQFSEKDFYHQFRTYPTYMRDWISELKEGQSAFENKDI